MAKTPRLVVDSIGRGAMDVSASALESIGIASNNNWAVDKGIEIGNLARALFPVDVTSADTGVKSGFGVGVFLAFVFFVGILAAIARACAAMMKGRQRSA